MCEYECVCVRECECVHAYLWAVKYPGIKKRRVNNPFTLEYRGASKLPYKYTEAPNALSAK